MFGKKQIVTGENLSSTFDVTNTITVTLDLHNCHLNEEAPNAFSVKATDGIKVETENGDVTSTEVTISFVPSSEGKLSVTFDLYLCEGEKCAKKGYILEFPIQKGSNTSHFSKIKASL